MPMDGMGLTVSGSFNYKFGLDGLVNGTMFQF